MKPQRKQLTIMLDAKVIKELERIAAQDHNTLTGVVRMMLNVGLEFIDEYKMKLKEKK